MAVLSIYPGDEIFASRFFRPFLPKTAALAPSTLDEVLPERR